MSTTSNTITTAKAARLRKLIGGAALGAALVGALPAAAFAKEIGSGGGTGGGGTTVCSPISSLTVRADAKTSDVRVGTVQVSYGVKPCTNGQSLTVRTTVAEYLNPAVVVYDNPAAPLDGRFTVGINIRVTYVITVAAYDAVTGALAGSQKAYAAAVPKPV